MYINPDMFPQAFAQDVNSTEASVMAVDYKSQLINQPLVNHLALKLGNNSPLAIRCLRTTHDTSRC